MGGAVRERDRERLINFKELAYVIVMVGKSKLNRASIRPGNPGRVLRLYGAESFLFPGTSVFFF